MGNFEDSRLTNIDIDPSCIEKNDTNDEPKHNVEELNGKLMDVLN